MRGDPFRFCAPLSPAHLSLFLARSPALSLIIDQATTLLGQSAKDLTGSGLDHLAVMGMGEDTVRLGGIGSGISEASKRVPIFSFATRQASEFLFSTGEFRQGHDQSLCLLLKQNPPLVCPIQMLTELACYLPSRDATVVSLLL